MSDQDYEFFEFASNTFSDSERINKGLSIARDTANTLFKLLKSPPITVCVYGYEEKQVNAIAKKSDGIYQISISTGALVRIFHWYKMWFQAPDMKELFQDAQDSIDVLVEKLYVYSIEYIAAHEFFHIMNGHCDVPENEEHFVSEKTYIGSDEQHLFSQILEFDADRAATRSCMYLLLSENTTFDNQIREIDLLVFALYNVFLLFQSDSKADFNNYMTHTFCNKDHPYDGIRFSYSFSFILDILLQFYPLQVVTDCFGFPIAKRLIIFEKRVLKAPEVKNCLFSASFTYQGAQHIMNLNNMWNEVAKKLKPYAYIVLAKGEHIPAMRIFLDNAGNFYKASGEDSKLML